ncbi:MAG: GLPGLI family protein [Bacteroidales bacterium]|jgi:GLPGLI family protein|nr:GLPGLI family protein [Bacteroidales bacterium]
MKRVILTICAIGLGLYVFAQQSVKQGEVVYEETMKLDFKFEGMTEEMKERLPKERKSKKILYFNENASSFQASKEQSNAAVPGMRGGGGGHGRGMGMRMMMMGGAADDKVYLNFTDNIKIEQKEFMSRVFLIEGEPAKDNWKLTGKQKMILDYPCMQASQITEKDTILAWFAPSIPVFTGPANYVNLPGLVLEVDINNGKRMIIAQKIDLKQIDDELIAKPKKGKKVTREEFQKIVDEKTKEMGGENQDGRRVIMRIHG